jgi:NAD(P)-dependent dehydrogenase (short-subunit alcohol dehydrogenase family)
MTADTSGLAAGSTSVLDLFRLDNRTFVVVGGMGYVGRAICSCLVEAGASVVCLDIRAPLESDNVEHSAIWNLYADISSKASVEAAMERVVTARGIPHGLINTACLQPSLHHNPQLSCSFEVQRQSSWEHAIELALGGVMVTCQVVGAAMASEGRGSIVNLASIFGTRSLDQRLHAGEDGQSRVYRPLSLAAAHAGVINLSRHLATYWADRPVRVNSISVGALHDEDDPAFRGAYEQRTALGRLVRANDVRGAVVYLLSDAASHVTGANLVVDGGWTAT